PDSPTYLMKISRFREYIHHAGLITIATSPGFMDQRKAIRIIRDLLSSFYFQHRDYKRSA
ncbi:MAG: hypothetical protein D6732_07950, partial [Methanobacteriota archaeon]